MRQAGRILYNLLTAISLLPFLAMVTVWVRSYWTADTFYWFDWPEDNSYFDTEAIWCSRGGIRLAAWRILSDKMRSPDHRHFDYDSDVSFEYPDYRDDFSHRFFFDVPRGYDAVGFEWIPKTTVQPRGVAADAAIFKSFTMPLYFLVALFAVPPTHYFLRIRRRRRQAKRIALNHCPACNYDLRYSTERCPECGSVITPGPASCKLPGS